MGKNILYRIDDQRNIKVKSRKQGSYFNTDLETIKKKV